MKTTKLFLILVFISSAALAQIQKGAGYLSGALNGTFSKGDDPSGNSNYNYHNSNWNFLMTYGHYLRDNFAIGIGAGVNFSDYKYENEGDTYFNSSEQKSTLFYITPFIRMSKKIADNFYLYGNLNLQIGSGPTLIKRDDPNIYPERVEGTQSVLGAGISGGLNYFLNRHFALTLSYGNISYVNTMEKINSSGNDEKTSSDGLNVNLGLSSVAIGLQYFINNASDKK